MSSVASYNYKPGNYCCHDKKMAIFVDTKLPIFGFWILATEYTCCHSFAFQFAPPPPPIPRQTPETNVVKASWDQFLCNLIDTVGNLVTNIACGTPLH